MSKSYRLLKDLPNVKAGEIFELGEDGCLVCREHSEVYTSKEVDKCGILDPDKGWFEEAVEAPFEEVATVLRTIATSSYVDPLEPLDPEEQTLIKVADRDYYEILPDGTKKTKFTWDEATEIEKKTHGKWRVPTVPEWFAICAAFGKSDDGTDVKPQVLRKNLDLAVDEDGYGIYWSAASLSTTSSYGLYFDSTLLNPRDPSNKGYGFAVRCVASAQ